MWRVATNFQLVFSERDALNALASIRKPVRETFCFREYSLIPGVFPCFILIRLNSAKSIVKTVDAFEAVMVNCLTASSALEAASSAASVTFAPSPAAAPTVAAAFGKPALAAGGATDGLLLPLLRGDDGEEGLSGADGGFSEVTFFLDADEDRCCLDVTASF